MLSSAVNQKRNGLHQKVGFYEGLLLENITSKPLKFNF